MNLGALLSARWPVVGALIFALAVAAALPLLRNALGPILGRAGAKDGGVDLSRDSLVWRDLCIVLLAGAFVLVTFSSDHYGYNVDEWYQTKHAAALYDWYGELFARGDFADFHAEVDAMKHYGGGFEILAELATRASPFDPISTRHLVTAWTALLGLVGAYLLGCTLLGRAAGFAAVLLLLLTPRFYGHFFSNPKDLPFAVGMLFALLAICRTLPALPRLSPDRIAITGAAIGLAASVRVGGMIALLYFCVALGWSLLEVLRRRDPRHETLRDVGALVVAGLGVLCTAWVVMLLFWPWAMKEPILRPVQALGYFQDVVGQLELDFTVFFEGERPRLSEVPRYFTVKFLLITMPEFALLTPLLLVPAFRLLRRRGLGWPDSQTMAWILCAIAVALPLAMTAGDGLIQYDGIRHFLFVVPPLAVLFAAALVGSLEPDLPLRFKAALASAGLALALITASDMWRLHPYEYVYYNRSIAGGLRHAALFYETDYLGLSYRDGVHWLLANYHPQHGGPIRVAGCPGFHVNLVDGLTRAGPEAARFQAVRPGRSPEVAVAATRSQCHKGYRGQLLATIDRDGVPLLYVLKLR